MKKKIVYIVIVVLVLGISGGVVEEYRIKEAMQITKMDALDDHFYDQYKWISDKFVKNTFVNEQGGIIGEESILSNLNLLYMEYLLDTNNRSDFKKIINFVQENLLTQEGLVAVGAYMDLGHQDMEVIQKALIVDNLKFYTFLTKAYVAWGESYYDDLAKQIADSLRLYDSEESKPNLHYVNEEGHKGEIALYDLKLKGIAYLNEYETIQKDIYQTSRRILQGAYIRNDFPLYYSYYDYNEEVYIKADKIDMLESLLIVKELASNNAHKEETIKWLKAQLKTGGIYEQYNAKTGIVTSHQERISIYAVIAQIGKITGDIELYTLAMEKMLSFQVKDPRSEGYGSFVAKGENEPDCYENLQALLAF